MSDEEDPCTVTETMYEKPSDGNGVHVSEDGVHVSYQPEEKSYVDRVKSSCGMIIVGLILFVGSFPLLGWNEKRAVERYDALNEGESQVQSISGLSLDPSNDGKLLHFTATLYNANSPLVDPAFNIQSSGLKLYRDTSMYQWKQHSTTKTTTLSDGTKKKDTTYNWKKGWYDSWINSKNFKDCKCPTDHRNPSGMEFKKDSWVASNVKIGAYDLPERLRSEITWSSSLVAPAGNVTNVSIRNRIRLSSGGKGFYFANSFVGTTPQVVPTPVVSTNPASLPQVSTPVLSPTKSSPGAVQGYSYVGPGLCQDSMKEGYPNVHQIYTFSVTDCGKFCDKFTTATAAAKATLRGFTWTNGPDLQDHCYCMFDSGTDTATLASTYGGAREHWGTMMPARSSNVGNGMGTILSSDNIVREGTEAFCYTLTSLVSAPSTNAVSSPTTMSTPVTTLKVTTDTFIRDGEYEETSYGYDKLLTVKKDVPGYTRIALLQFDNIPATSTLARATLRLYANEVGADPSRTITVGKMPTNFVVYEPSTPWAVPSGLATTSGWDTNPNRAYTAMTNFVVYNTQGRQWIDVDVTSLLNPEGGQVTFALENMGTTSGQNAVNFLSRENAGYEPQLVFETKAPIRGRKMQQLLDCSFLETKQEKKDCRQYNAQVLADATAGMSDNATAGSAVTPSDIVTSPTPAEALPVSVPVAGASNEVTQPVANTPETTLPDNTSSETGASPAATPVSVPVSNASNEAMQPVAIPETLDTSESMPDVTVSQAGTSPNPAEATPVSTPVANPASEVTQPAVVSNPNPAPTAPAASSPVPLPAVTAPAAPTSPKVGDQKVSFRETRPATFTIMAAQKGQTLQEWVSETGEGGEILFFKQGTHSSEVLFDEAEASNKAATWALRFVGFAVMTIGLYLVFRPIVVMTDVIPCVGSIVGCGIKFMAITISAVLSMLTISIAWLVVHPKIGGITLVVSLAVIGLCAFVFKKFFDKGKDKLEEAGLKEKSLGLEGGSKTDALDLNGDGKVDSSDVKMAVEMAKNSDKLDLNNDGKVDGEDAKIAVNMVKNSDTLDLNNDGKVDGKDAKIAVDMVKKASD